VLVCAFDIGVNDGVSAGVLFDLNTYILCYYLCTVCASDELSELPFAARVDGVFWLVCNPLILQVFQL